MLGAASLLAVGLTIAGAAQAPVPAAAAPPPDRPFTGLIANLGHDVAALPSTATAAALAVGGVGALVTHPSDDNVAGWMAARPHAAYTSVGRVAGDGWTQAGIAVGTYVLGVAVHHRPTSHLGADLIRGQFLTGLVTHGLKLGVDRRRPSGGPHSFPSGHTSSAFLTAAVVGEHYGWRAGLPAYALAGFIGWTRVRDDAHWMTDVIVGGTVGTIVGRTVARGHRAQSWTVSISPGAGGFAVSIVRIPSDRTRAARSSR
ncbi:MAG: phosphatase PAP2 family protein [Acidobacteria bacterium]|nr:phosphatase PAP2 family protein [Acidobacteriota bacterium]